MTKEELAIFKFNTNEVGMETKASQQGKAINGHSTQGK